MQEYPIRHKNTIKVSSTKHFAKWIHYFTEFASVGTFFTFGCKKNRH